MLTLDHIPFYSPDPDQLAAGFARLGFTVSPPSRYAAPDHPDAAWRGRCVFTQDGWLDLLFEERPRWPGAPASLLFRTDDLKATRQEFVELNPQAPFRLERRWADAAGQAPEPFAYAELRSRIAPFVLAAIEHPWPFTDVRAEWMVHPNGALQVAALILGGEAPGPSAATAARFLDPTALEYWPQDAFDEAFPGASLRRALRIRVADLPATAAVLAAAGAEVRETSQGLAAPPQFGVAAGLLFSA